MSNHTQSQNNLTSSNTPAYVSIGYGTYVFYDEHIRFFYDGETQGELIQPGELPPNVYDKYLSFIAGKTKKCNSTGTSGQEGGPRVGPSGTDPP